MAHRRRRARPKGGGTVASGAQATAGAGPAIGAGPAFGAPRRPSNPLFLAATGVMWVAAGLVVVFRLHAGWRFAPALVFVAVGLILVWAASVTVLRRDHRRTT